MRADHRARHEAAAAGDERSYRACVMRQPATMTLGREVLIPRAHCLSMLAKLRLPLRVDRVDLAMSELLRRQDVFTCCQERVPNQQNLKMVLSHNHDDSDAREQIRLCIRENNL